MIAAVGAGWSGAVIARELAEAGRAVTVFESRRHVGGNCYTELRRGIVTHVYGPHIFHTSNEDVWRYVQRWGEFAPYRLQVRSTSHGEVFAMPVNLHTLNQLYHATWSPAEARRQVLEHDAAEPVSFEDAAMRQVGALTYRRLFRGYTAKQWGVDPATLPASVFHRLPVRFDYDDNYFTHRHQAMPVDGYTPLFRRLLDHPLIDVRTSTPFDLDDAERFDHVFWTGSLDAWFRFGLGRLRYRTLDFRWHVSTDTPFQGVALMNWPDIDVVYTRVVEHAYLSPTVEFPDGVSVVSFETPREARPSDVPFYPLRLADDRSLLDRYVDMGWRSLGVSFVGRLGTYRYIDMDVAVAEALDAARRFVDGDVSPFYVTP